MSLDIMDLDNSHARRREFTDEQMRKGHWEPIAPDSTGEFAWVGKKYLNIDHNYQRTVAENMVRKIGRAWTWAACGALIVVRRPNRSLYVVDGQHRLETALQHPDIGSLPCMIYPVGTQEEEARIFLTVNKVRRSVPSFSAFRASVCAEDPSAIRIQSIIEANGYTVSDGRDNSRDAKIVRCLTAAQKIYKLCGDENFERAFPLVAAMHNGARIEERILLGVIYLYATTDGRIAGPPYRKRLVETGPKALLDGPINGAVKLYCNHGPKVYAEGLLAFLNVRRSSNKLVMGPVNKGRVE